MKLATLLLSAVMFLSVSEGGRLKRFCPRDWSLISGRCLTYVPAPLTWAQAEKNCLSLGGNLVSARNSRAYRAIQRFIFGVTHRSGRTWIGGSDAAEKRVWLWTDGKPMKYINWCPHEPNNYGGNENCLEMNHGGGKCWNDLNCATRQPSVCARKRRFWIRVRG